LREAISFSRESRSKIPPYLKQLSLEMFDLFMKAVYFFFQEKLRFMESGIIT